MCYQYIDELTEPYSGFCHDVVGVAGSVGLCVLDNRANFISVIDFSMPRTPMRVCVLA